MATSGSGSSGLLQDPSARTLVAGDLGGLFFFLVLGCRRFAPS